MIFRSRNRALVLFKQKSSYKLSSFRIQEPIKKTWLVIYLDITRHKWDNFARTHILKLVIAVVTLTNNGSSHSKNFAETPETLRQSPRGSFFFSAKDTTLQLGVILTAYPKFVNFTVWLKISLQFNSNLPTEEKTYKNLNKLLPIFLQQTKSQRTLMSTYFPSRHIM